MKTRFFTRNFALILILVILSVSFSAPGQSKRRTTAKPKTAPVEIIESEMNPALAASWNSGTLPAPLPLPEGNADEIAAILAQKVAAKNNESIPALLAALRLSGFFVTDKSGKVIIAPADGKGQGLTINGWEAASAAKMYGEGRETNLNDLSDSFRSFPALKNADVAELILTGIRRNAENENNAFLRVWARFIAELGKNSGAKYDILSGADKEQVKLDAIQHLLIFRRLFGDAYARAEKYKTGPSAASEKVPDSGFQARSGSNAKFINASFSRADNFGVPPVPADKRSSFDQIAGFYKSNFAASDARFDAENISSSGSPAKTDVPCRLDGSAPTVMDASATIAGVGFDQFMGYLEDVWEDTPAGKAVGKYGQALGFANAVLAYAKFLQTYAALETRLKFDDAPPVVREKNARYGVPKKLKAEVRMNIGNWQTYNCVRTALNVSTGIDFSTVNDGPIGDVGVRWHLDEGGAGDVYSNSTGITGNEQIVGFHQPGATRIQDAGTGAGVGSKNVVRDLTYTKTDEQGVARIMLRGSPQENAKLGKVVAVLKRAVVRTTIKLKAGEIKGDMVDVAGQAIGGIGGLVTMPAELLYRMDWASSGTLIVPVRDWEETDESIDENVWTGTITAKRKRREEREKRSGANLAENGGYAENITDIQIKLTGKRDRSEDATNVYLGQVTGEQQLIDYEYDRYKIDEGYCSPNAVPYKGPKEITRTSTTKAGYNKETRVYVNIDNTSGNINFSLPDVSGRTVHKYVHKSPCSVHDQANTNEAFDEDVPASGGSFSFSFPIESSQKSIKGALFVREEDGSTTTYTWELTRN
jgi:hypothetical protein